MSQVTPEPEMVTSNARIPYLSNDGEHYFGQPPLKDIQKQLALRVLSDADLEFWRTYGYVIVRAAITAQQAQKTMDCIWEFERKSPDNPSKWHRDDSEFVPGWSWEKEMYSKGLVECYHHQLFWDNRMAQRVYDAFVDVWDVEELWVSIDRANLNFGSYGNRADGSFIHWDIDITKDILPLRVQGIIALTDTEQEVGGFQCVPGLFKDFDVWRKNRPAGAHPFNPRPEEFQDYSVINPELKAGDMLIFNSSLLHGISKNMTTDKARAVQYIAMMPALERQTQLKEARIKSWSEVLPPNHNVTFLGDKLRPEASRYGKAELNEHGKKLLGLASW